MDKTPQISCSFDSQSSLYSAYMPFIKGGGLFLRTHDLYPLGIALNLSVQLMDEPELYWVDGKIVWITPKGAQGNKLPGIGVQFMSANSRYLCNKIEAYLAEMLKSPQLTDTI